VTQTPGTVFGKLDPGFDRRIGHRQNRHAGDTEALGELTGDLTWRPARREQLGTSNVGCQVLVAEPKPGLAAEALERIHGQKGVAARTPAALFVDHARQRV